MIIEIPDEQINVFIASLKKVKRNKEVCFIVAQMEKLKQDEENVTRLYKERDVEGMKRLLPSLNSGFWRFQALCFIQEFEKGEV